MRTEKFNLCKSTKKLLTLITLLTLGVGQMWAATSTTLYCAVDASKMESSDGNKTCYKLVCNTNHKGDADDWHEYDMSKTDYTKDGKLIYSVTFTDSYNGLGCIQFQIKKTDNTWIEQVQPFGTKSWTEPATYNNKLWVYGSTGWNTYSKDASYTVYFVNTNSWTAANVKAYAFNNDCDYNAGWSGTKMTSVGKNYNGKGIYSITLDKRYAKIIFSNNGSSQTSDLTLGTTNAGKMWDGDSWETLQYDVALDQQSATTDGTTSITATPGSSKPSIASLPSKTGYDFGGYFTSTGGDGTKYYNADGSAVSGNWPAIASGPTTLYAKWTKKTYTVTINNDGNGTTSPSGAQSSIAQVDGIAIDATANTNYEFVDWEIISGTGSFASSTTTKLNRFYPTSTATIQANFRSTLTNSLTVAAGSHVGTVTGSTDPVTLGNSYAISASNFTSGYEFYNWTADPAANATFASSTSASTNVTVKNGSVTVTANAREIMRDITIVGGTVYGDVATSTTAGVATSAKITANAPAAGKKFTGWDLGSGVSLKGGYAVTDRTIEIYSTANATVTAQYANRAGVKVYFAKPSGWSTAYVYAWKSSDDSKKNAKWPGEAMASTETINYITYYTYQYYTEADGIGGAATGNSEWNSIKFTDNGDGTKRTGDLTISDGHYYFKSSSTTGKATAPTSAWCIKGAWNSWSEDADQITHSAAATGSKSITLTTGDKEFKIYNLVEETWWRFSGNVTATKAATALNDDAGNMTITPSVAGPYTFALAGLTGTKTLAITYPTTYTVTFNAETFVNGGASHSTSTTGGTLSAVDGNDADLSSGGKVISGGTAVITASKNTGYSFINFYTNAACSTVVSGTGVSISDNVLTYTGISGNKTAYAKFSENMTSVTLQASPTGKGSFTIAEAAATNTTAGVTTTRSVTAVPAAGYYVNTSSTVWSTNNANISLSNVKSNPVTVTGGGSGGTSTLTATFTPNPYSVSFSANGGDGDAMSDQNFTYDVAQALSTNTYTKTGYNFDGWATSAGGAKVYNDKESVSNLTTTKDATYPLFAHWTAKQSAITFDYQTSVPGYASSGDITNRVGLKGTYDAEMTALTGTMPSAINGYAFTGFYDATSGGTKYYNADGSSAHVWDKDTEEGTTLYARWEIAQITNIAFSPGTTVSPKATVTLTPTVSPAPTGATVICWKLLRNNGNLLSEEFTSNPSTPGNNVTFTAPETSSSYKVAAVLRTGSGCGTGTVLDSVVYDLVVAGSHTVTIRYQDSDGRTLAASTETEGRPLAWSSEINPATITGYTFDHWVAGDGVTITTDDGETTVTETSTETIKIQATYDGPLTAVYNKKKMIFFNNTLNWDTVYVYFYKNSSYWDGSNGAGTEDEMYTSSYSGVHGGMTKIAGTSVYYFDAQAVSAGGYTNVAFTEKAQDNCWYFYEDNKVVRRTDYDATHLPMYVPLAGETGTKMNGNAATYYDKGYWMNYPENTGYWLKIYNKTATDGATKLYDLPFTFPEDHAMPLELAVDLEAGQTYGFEIARADGNNYRNTGTMTATTTDWDMTTGKTQYCGLQTTAAGEYIFRLAYFAVSSNYQYRVGVTYPVAVNDYRIVYTDLATWSKAAHTAETWCHPSGVITKNSSATEVKKDTVSFFWSYGSTPAIKYQTCTAVAAGSASWSAGTSISVSDFSSVLKEKGVYNFIFEQPAGGASISLVKVEPYSGNYYIRTDCAGSTKWVNYRALDHQMTYSDYAEANSGYSHYFCHWVTTGTNVKFVIANDYSACISDTLSEDYGVNKIANITAEGNNGAGTLNSGNASIRFMWNQATNKINRAYISGSSNVSDRFLILEGDAKLYDENGNSYSISGLDANEVNLIDDQNFVYERTIKVNATAKAKLTAKYNNNVQYFKGGSGSTAEDSVQLLGGTYNVANKYSMRLVYDFKTDRLVTAYIPEGTVDAQLNIQADLMIIREHQEAGQQLLFSGSGALKEVQSVYGVMRFNRWTLNNRQHPEDHDKAHCWNDALITTYHPLLGPGNVKSIYERALYWISFPFDVNLSDVFGFGTYGTHWIIMKYNGAQRATDGYWKDSEGFWEYIWDRSNVTLEKGKGYVLALELELMQATDSVNFWTHQIQEVELFFPSASTEVGTITRASVDVTVPPHECTIDRRTKAEKDAGTNNWDKDRRVADSHWNIIGVPSYANYGSTLTKDKEGTQTITWNSNPKTQSLPFLYEWNASDNTYTVQSGTTYNFKAMHAYYVQYTGNLHWTLASATPPSIVARRTYAEAPESIEMKIELQQNETMIDQTFVKLSNDDNVSAGFAFGEDLNKEKNAGKANIYTFIDNYMPTAGNTMPMIDQTTFIPMGVSIPTAGEYTFAIPEGTDGVGVFLIDNVANTRTNLSALDYTVNLTTGTHDGRFVLEISPIHNATTDIEAISDEGLEIGGARKVLIDGILYIVKGDKLYDVRGTMIK